jgi:hypothetical protein
MLNRTNRTLSANPNRLNLGTRNLLALVAGGNTGSQTLRTAHEFPTAVVRAGFEEYSRIQGTAKPISAMPKPLKPAMSATPGSSPSLGDPSWDSSVWDQGQAAMSSQPTQTSAALESGDGARTGSDTPLTPPQGHSRSNLGRRCDRTRRAGRSARAVLALVTGATPTS